MSGSSFLSLRGAFVSLSGGSSSLLGDWLSSRTLDISLGFGDLGFELALHVEVMEDLGNNVPPQGIVEVGVVEVAYLPRELTVKQIENWKLDVLVGFEGPGRPGLGQHFLRVCFGHGARVQVEFLAYRVESRCTTGGVGEEVGGSSDCASKHFNGRIK